MNYFLHGFGVFLGVIAGVAVSLITQYIILMKMELQKKRNLKFELRLDISKINKWLEEITRYRNAVNGDSLVNYFGYFDLSHFITVTANEMFRSGLLYKYLDHESIGKLQVIFSEFSLAWENLLNNQITQYKQRANNPDTWPILKREVIQNIDFWERKFKDHKKTLDDIIEKIS